jgi:hypothetical protein
MRVSRKHNPYDEPERGRTVLFVALALIPLAALTGVAIDFGMAFVMRQRLDAVAQSALASALAQSRSLRDVRFDAGVEEMESKGRGRADLVFNAQKPQLRDIRTTFTLQGSGAANEFNARVTYAASVNTVFLRFVGLPELEIDGQASTVWTVRDSLIDDKFDAPQFDLAAAGRKAFAAPAGWAASAPRNLIQLAAAARYEGPPPPEGVKVVVELDTPDGNVAISKKFAAEPGAHQLRYWYRDRAKVDRLAPAWLCGTREEDVEWLSARDSSAAGDTNRMSVYLSTDVKDAPPSATALNASARVDSCYTSGYRWIQRTVKIDILTRGDYWLTFRGEGRADATGAAIANVLLCREPCRDDGALPPPTANLPWNPGEMIFEDRFRAADAGGAAPGWIVWPGGAGKLSTSQGALSGYVELDTPSGDAFENRKMGRPFLLTPGFYLLRYGYSAGPNSTEKTVACNYFGLEAAMQRSQRGKGADTRQITLVIDPDQPYMHPEASAQEGGKPEWRTAARALERDVTGLKRTPLPDMSNAVDFCVGAPPNVVVNREITFRIDKPGYYWITFVAGGPADGESGRIGAVQLFAQGTRFAGQGIPRIIRHSERGDVLTPSVGALLVQPPGATGQRALYRVQVQ